MKTSRIPGLAAIVAVASTFASAQSWFDLDVTRGRDSLLRGAKPSFTRGVVDSGTHLVFRSVDSSYYEFAGFRQPRTEPWYVVARVRLDAFGAQESWYISSFLNTTTWSSTGQDAQGFELRVGGGRFYPQIASGSVAERNALAARDYFTSDRNAAYSTCLLELVQATNNPQIWKETFSTRCLEKGVWHQIAAGWDGRRQTLFIDGSDVLDTNRLIGDSLAPVLDSAANLYVGRRRPDSHDFRLLNGAVQSIRMVSGVLDSATAASLYRSGQPAVQGSCDAVPVVEYPLTFQYAFTDESARLSLARSPRCAEGEIADATLHPGDSIDVMAVSADSKGQFLAQTTVGSLEFPLSQLGVAVTDSSKTIRLKVRLRRAPAAGRSASVATTPEWNDDRPLVLGAAPVSVGRDRRRLGAPRQIDGHWASVPGAESLTALDPDGRRVVLDASRRRADGAWDLSILPRGLWIVTGGVAPLRFARF